MHTYTHISVALWRDNAIRLDKKDPYVVVSVYVCVCVCVCVLCVCGLFNHSLCVCMEYVYRYYYVYSGSTCMILSHCHTQHMCVISMSLCMPVCMCVCVCVTEINESEKKGARVYDNLCEQAARTRHLFRTRSFSCQGAAFVCDVCVCMCVCVYTNRADDQVIVSTPSDPIGMFAHRDFPPDGTLTHLRMVLRRCVHVCVWVPVCVYLCLCGGTYTCVY